MKRYISFFLALLLLGCLSGCGGGEAAPPAEEQAESSVPEAPEEAPAEEESSFFLLPDPEYYFGLEAAEVTEGGTGFRFDDLGEDGLDILAEYTMLLVNDYGFEAPEPQREDEETLFVFEETATWFLWKQQEQGGSYSMTVYFDDTCCELLDLVAHDPPLQQVRPRVEFNGVGESEPESESAPEPAPEPEPVVEKTPLSLPDPGPFLGGLNRNEDMDAYGGHLVSYKFDLDEGREVAEEYRQLLESWGNLEYDWEEEPFSWKGRTFTGTYYRYVGEGGITPIDITGTVCDVRLSISYYADNGYVLLTLYYPPEMYVIDSGEKASSFPTDFIRGSGSGGGSSSGGSSSGGGSDREPSRPETDCFKCNGDGDITCSRCNGAGGKEIRESVPNYSGDTSGPKYATTWESCSKCIGTGEMTCTACGGSGVN